MAQTIKIGSMNVRGLFNRAKRLDIFNWINNKNNKNPEGWQSCSSQDCIIRLKNLIILENLLILDLEVYGNPLILIVLYDPNKDQPNFYSSLRDTLIEKDNDPIIICGDWNLVLDFSIDTHNYICENNINSRKMVKELMCVLDLIDTWRPSNPRTKTTLGLVVQNQLKWPD